MAFLEGFAIGLSMIIFIGPVFFTLLKSTLQYGIAAGMMVALGILISDVVAVLLCAFGAIPFFKNADNQYWLAIGGSIILLGLGLKYLIKPTVSTKTELRLNTKEYSAFFVKGFLVNFVNPFVFMVWIGVIGYGHGKFGFNTNLITFLGASLLGIITTDSAKVLFAHKIKHLIQPKVLNWIYRVCGLLLIGFAIRLIFFVIK